MKPSLLKKLRARDSYCWHCGDDRIEELAPHHRLNRKAGGRKSLDRLDNLLLVCPVYNGLIESDATEARKARELGYKLREYQGFDTPVFDAYQKIWYKLTEEGERIEVR